MPVIWRVVLFLYNLLLLVLSGSVVASAWGWDQPLNWVNAVFAVQSSRMAAGAIGLLLAVLAVIMLVWCLKFKRTPQSVIIDSSLQGQISITIPALKSIIMKAVKKVEGIKDIKPAVTSRPDGLQIYLHLMVNPDYSMEEMGEEIQKVVKDYVERIGGVQVAAVKILVDDFNATGKQDRK